MRKSAMLAGCLVLGGVALWLATRHSVPDLAAPTGVNAGDPAAHPAARASPDAHAASHTGAGRGVASPVEVPAPTLQPGDWPGRVVHAQTGAPLPGATIVTAGIGSAAHALFQMRTAVPVDEAGRFAWRPGAYPERLCARVADVGVSDWVTVRPGGEPTEIVLRVEPGNVICGVVRDYRTREPVRHARVELMDAESNADRPAAPSTLTDADGRYAILGVPVRVTVRPRVVRSAGAGLSGLREASSTGENVWFDALGGRAERDLYAYPYPGIGVTYRLRFPAGVPVPATVVVEHTVWIRRRTEPGESPRAWGSHGPGARERTTAFDSRGTDTPPELRVEVSERRTVALDPAAPAVTLHVPVGSSVVAFEAEPYVGRPPRIELRGLEADRTIDVAMAALPGIWVQLVDEHGGAVERAGVTVETRLRRLRPDGAEPVLGGDEHMTDAHGRADISAGVPRASWAVPPGAIDLASLELGGLGSLGVYASHPDFYRAEWSPFDPGLTISIDELERRLSLSAGSPVVLAVPLRRSSPVAFVVRASGDYEPVAGVRVRGEPPDLFDAGAVATSDARGRVVLQYRGSGSSGEDPPPERVPRVVVDDGGWSGERPLVDFALQARAAAPVPALLDTLGEVGLQPAAMAAVRESLLASAVASWRQTTRLSEGDAAAMRERWERAEWDPPDLFISPGKTVRLRCALADGTPLADAALQVYAFDPAGGDDTRRVRSDASGHVVCHVPTAAPDVSLSVESWAGTAWPDVSQVTVAVPQAGDYVAVFHRVRTVAVQVAWPPAEALVESGRHVRELRWTAVDPTSGESVDVRLAEPGQTTETAGALRVPVRPLQVTAATTGGAWAAAVTVPLAAEGALEFRLQKVLPTHAVRLALVTPEGASIGPGDATVWVMVHHSTHPGSVLRSADSGGVVTLDLPEGTFAALGAHVERSGRRWNGSAHDVVVPTDDPLRIVLHPLE